MNSILLISAPYTDYTQPYHSLSYLAPPLRQAGYEVDIIDLNVEWFRWIFTSSTLEKWKHELEEDLQVFEAMPSWDVSTQKRVIKCIEALAFVQDIEPEKAIDILQSEKFYNFEDYLSARQCVRRFERVLEYIYDFFPFYLAFKQPFGEPVMSDLIQGISKSERYIKDIEAILGHRFTDKQYFFCGVSIPFYGCTRMGLAAMNAVARVFPDAIRVAGGTAVTDMYKACRGHGSLHPLAKTIDYILLGEADDEIVDFAEFLKSMQPTSSCTAKIPPNGLFDVGNNKLLKDDYIISPVKLKNDHNYTPDYSWINWDLYLSPEKQINYSPTRGCFWNKCSFCDYGLNDDLPTAPYRSEEVNQTLRNLSIIAASGIQNIYLAVDAVSPAFLKKLALGIVKMRLDISWSAELFLTGHFDSELITLLESSGMVTASFGYESGSSRILELMGKGKDRVDKVYRPVFEAFRQSRIGLQPKFFFGFPGETRAESWESVELLLNYRDVFSVLTSGNIFDLTEGSIVAKEPLVFGIRNNGRKEHFDINYSCDYELCDGSSSPVPTDFLQQNATLDYFEIYERPWAGGIDAFHTKLYIKQYGKNIFTELQEKYRKNIALIKPLSTVSLSSRFDLPELFENVLILSSLEYSCSREIVNCNMNEDEIRKGLEAASVPLERSNKLERFSLEFR